MNKEEEALKKRLQDRTLQLNKFIDKLEREMLGVLKGLESFACQIEKLHSEIKRINCDLPEEFEEDSD